MRSFSLGALLLVDMHILYASTPNPCKRYACDLSWVVRVGIGNIMGAASTIKGIGGIEGPYQRYTALTIILRSPSYCAHHRTALTIVLRSPSYCAHHRTALTIILLSSSYCAHHYTALTVILRSPSYCAHHHTALTSILLSSSYCSHHRNTCLYFMICNFFKHCTDRCTRVCTS